MAGETGEAWIAEARAEVEAGMSREKCHACGCMHDGLARFEHVLSQTGTNPALRSTVKDWKDDVEPIETDCRGCSHCYPAEAVNILREAHPEVRFQQTDERQSSRPGSSGKQIHPEQTRPVWPPLAGEYHVVGDSRDCPVAVTTLADEELAERVAARDPADLCIVGPTQTENTGIEKLLKNTVSNPAIEVLVVAGPEPNGHRTGATLRALHENGVDGEMNIIDAPGEDPVVPNATRSEVQTFRERLTLVDRIGCTDIADIVDAVESHAEESCGCPECRPETPAVEPEDRISADPNAPVSMDPAGYFVVIPQPDSGSIVCEHYDYDHTKLHVIEGASAADIYREAIERELLSRMDHAAYLGAELAKAEVSLREGLDYEQDKKPM